MTFLALDLGVSSLTAAVWSPSGLVSLARSVLPNGAGPREWWDAVEAAVRSLDADLVEVEALGCAASSGTFALLARDGEPLGPWSAGAPLPERTGWIANGRDFLASLLTGRLASDPTAASATGFFTPSGTLDADAVAAAGVDPEWLPPQTGSTDVLGDLLLPAAKRLGLRSRVPVVMGATSQMCAVEGAGALPVAPLVTYGSPVVVSVPVEPPVTVVPEGVSLRAGGRSYQVFEARCGSADEVASAVGLLAPDAKFLYGAGDADRAWTKALPTSTGLPVVHRRSREHVTLGLAMLVATGVGDHIDRDRANPIAYVDEPVLA